MTAIETQDLTVSLGSRIVLRGVSLAVERGTMVGLIGPNGAGKTTMLRALAGVQPVESGQVLVGGTAVEVMSRAARARAVSYLPQGANVHWPLAAERVVALGRLLHLHAWGRYGTDDHDAVRRVLDDVDAVRFAERPVTSLSTGERARVLLARALAGDPQVLLADEPVAALDPSHQLDVLDLLRRRCADGLSVLVVLHDLTLAARYCDALVLLVDGAARHHGAPGAVLTTDILRDAYGIEGSLKVTEGVPYVIARKTITRGGGEPVR